MEVDPGRLGHDTDAAVGGRQLVAAVQAATRLATEVMAYLAAGQRAAARRDEYAVRAARDSARDRRRRDQVVWRRVHRRGWWSRATAGEIAEAWAAASTWAVAGDEAAAAQRVIAARLARRGVDVTAPTARPGDQRWLRVANTAQAAQGPVFVGTSEADAQRLAALVRAYWTGRGRRVDVDAVLGSGDLSAGPAAAFLRRVHQHEQLGGRVADVLDRVRLDGAHTPAALAEYQVERSNIDLAAMLDRHRDRARQVIGDRLRTLAGDRADPVVVGVLTGADRDLRRAVDPRPVIDAAAADPRVDQPTRDALAAVVPPRAWGPDPAPTRPPFQVRETGRARRGARGTNRGRGQPPPPALVARYADLVRRECGGQTADTILTSPQWETRLVPVLARWEAAGRPIGEAMSTVRATAESATARHPAALAAHRLRHWLAGRSGAESLTPGMAAVAESYPGTVYDAIAHATTTVADRPTQPAAHRTAARAVPTPQHGD